MHYYFIDENGKIIANFSDLIGKPVRRAVEIIRGDDKFYLVSYWDNWVNEVMDMLDCEGKIISKRLKPYYYYPGQYENNPEYIPSRQAFIIAIQKELAGVVWAVIDTNSNYIIPPRDGRISFDENRIAYYFLPEGTYIPA